MNEPSESRMLADVRRWRREAHEQWSRLPLPERAAEEKRLIAEFGLEGRDVSPAAGDGTSPRLRKAS